MDEEAEGEPFKMMDNIPFQYVTYGMYYKLANKLDPDSAVSGNNWRMLAEKLGYTTQEIFVFESKQSDHGRNTIKVFQDFSQKQGSTVNDLFKALEDIERPDALDELKAGIREIEKNYTESLQKKHRHQDLVEDEYICSTCDDMPYANKGYPSYSQGHHEALMPPCNGYGMYTRNHQISSSSSASKAYLRHKSVDTPCIRMQAYDHMSPEFKRQRSMPVSDSMMVRGRDGHSQFIRDVEPMEMSPSVHDEAVPPALAMMRGMSRYNNIPGVPSLKTRVHSKDPDSMFRPPYGGHYNRQTERAGLKLEIPPPSEMFNRQRSGEFYSPSPTPTTPSTPLGQLQKLANETPIQPEDGFKDLMKLKLEEELLQGKMGQNMEGSDKMEFTSSSGMCISGPNGDEQSQMMYHRSKVVGPPNTFPLRLKSSGTSSSSSSPTSTSQQLTKSTSLPGDMKPAEFRKAFRHIKVFVTYTADDKKHTQRVLSLCKCLEKNGFTCCVDIFHRKLPVEERHGWYQQRFDEADFILVVMSPKYRREVDSCEMENDADDSDSVESDADNDLDDRPYRLHTKNIYRLMYREYAQSGQRCMRFVPLVFPGMSEDIIPRWMLDAYNRLFYYWPKQYKDLLWMLTKPENRVPEHVTPPVNRCPQDNGHQMTSDTPESNSELE